MQTRKARHLRPALNLKHADCIRLLQGVIHCGIVSRQLRQIDLFPIMIADKRDGFFQRGHHSQTQQVNFDDAEVGAIFLIPLHHHPAGHAGRLQRNNRVQLSLANDHTAGVLSQVARQVLHGHTQLEELANARMPQIEAGIAKLALQSIAGVLVLPRTH